MSNAAQLQPVLDRIDADFDNSLERLFALLRIKSISADPAFAGDCKAAADHLARDIATLGFATDVRPTAGHPAIVAKAHGGGKEGRPRVLFYGHYDVQPVDPLTFGIVRHSSLSLPIMPTDERSSSRGARKTTRVS
jgi:amidohydrolase